MLGFVPLHPKGVRPEEAAEALTRTDHERMLLVRLREGHNWLDALAIPAGVEAQEKENADI